MGSDRDGRVYDGDLWDRQSWETARAYEVFLTYLDLGPDRTLTAVADHHGYASTTQPSRWSHLNAWRERVQAYDAHLLEAARREREGEHAEALRRFATRQGEVYQVLNGVATHCLRIARDRLVGMTREEIAEISVRDLAHVLRTAAYVAEVAGNAQAQALGVEELLMALVDE